MTLALSILLHALLGVALAAVLWLTGVAVALRLPGRQLANAYAAGLLIVVAAAFVALLSGLLLPVALAAVALLTWRGARTAGREACARAGRSLAAALPGTLAFAVALGLFQRGPDDEHGSNSFGDLVFYVAELRSAAQSVAPFRDLSLVGFDHTYVQSAPVFLGAALDVLPGLDPFLFFAATLPACLFASVAIGLGTIEQRGAAVIAALLALGALVYPTWLSESPPVTLAAPVAFSFFAFAAAPALAGAALAAAGLVVTKGVGLVPLAALVAVGLGRRDRRRAFVALVGGAAAAVGLVLAADLFTELLVLEFLPAEALDGVREQLDARNTQQLAPGLMVAGHVLLVVATARLRRPELLAAVAASVGAVWFIGGQGADAALVLSGLLVALEVSALPPERTTRLLFAGAASFLVAGAWFREVAGVGTGAALLALAALALLGGFNALRFRSLALLAAGTLSIALVAGFLRLSPSAPPLTREHAELAHRVSELPPSALVFTSLTGPHITSDEGWNYYGAVSARQHYIAGWANSELRVHPRELEERLRLNRLALAGEAGPALAEAGISADRPLYAVLRTGEQAPPGARRVYANDRFALYELRAP